MKKRLFLGFTAALWVASLFPVVPTYAQEVIEDTSLVPEETFYKGEILDITETPISAGTQLDFAVRILNGDIQGESIEIVTTIPEGNDTDRFAEGDKVVIVQNIGPNGTLYFIADHYRIPWLVVLLIVFLGLAAIFARKKAAGALGGLVLSIIILVAYIVPQIAAGKNPMVIGLIGAVAISIVSLYVAHGWQKRTTIALAGMLITILLAAVFAWIAVMAAQMIGIGSEEAYNLQISFNNTIDLRGLLLVGIIIGALGVLDDITTSISATVEELKKANPALTSKELYTRALNVGTEHIASLVNTLVLAYAGASLPLLLLFSLDNQPIWVTLNSQFMAEEIVRTLIGSTALVIAVPITTFIAAHYFGNQIDGKSKN